MSCKTVCVQLVALTNRKLKKGKTAMDKITKLFAQLDSLKEKNNAEVNTLNNLIQAELNLVYSNWPALYQAIALLQDSKNFELREDGLYSWLRFYELSEVSIRRREYLDAYLIDSHGVHCDFSNDCLLQYLGEDFISIQYDTRSDNGVWHEHKLVIEESEYRNDDGEISEVLRNNLIESYMEKIGCYPGVFEISRDGDVRLVNTSIDSGEK